MYCSFHEVTHPLGSRGAWRCGEKLREIKKGVRQSERTKVEKEMRMKYFNRISKLEFELEIRKERTEELEKEKKEKEEFIEEMARKPGTVYAGCNFQMLDITDVSEFCKRSITDTVRELKFQKVHEDKIREEVGRRTVVAILDNPNISGEGKLEQLEKLHNGERNEELERHLESELRVEAVDITGEPSLD